MIAETHSKEITEVSRKDLLCKREAIITELLFFLVNSLPQPSSSFQAIFR